MSGSISWALVVLPNRKGILTGLQREVLEQIFSTVETGSHFALSGGTALHEFYAGARRSNDLDLLTYAPDLVRPFARAIVTALPKSDSTLSVRMERDFENFATLIATAPAGDAVRIDVGAADPPALGPIREAGGVRVLDLADIVAGKAHAIADRVEPRDAFDLWVIVNQLGYSMEAVEALLFEKDYGLREYPVAWVSALNNLAGASDLMPPDLQQMILTPVQDSQLRQFLGAAAEAALDRARQRLPG